MKLAFLYAGQGTQHPGMGRDLYETYPAFRQVLDSAQLDFDLKELCFEGPEEKLSQTQYTQPCMVAFAAGVTAVLREKGIIPEVAAGLSLGEYSALQAAGVFANYNCPTQLVIAGDAAAVEKAGELALQAGAKRVVPLKVSGPFHTSLMAPAGEALAEKFRSVAFGEMSFPVLFNCKGGPMEAGETIPELLVRQVQSSVYLEDTIRAMAGMGVDTIVEIGPGKALSAFVKKTEKGIKTYAVETVEDIEKLCEALKGEQA